MHLMILCDVMWSSRIGVELNQEKVHLLQIGWTYTLGKGGPDKVAVEQEKDLGVIISRDLKFEKMVS